ncbi:MAG TPA: DUF2934 domain-containing protein [Candidatus Sulfotelmatobacter sp.]|nr:DUF2934 domain-containing protein [Candidatus Sulfotelmatobacter sp.]
MKLKSLNNALSMVGDSILANEPPSLLPRGTTLDLTKTDDQRIRELAFHFYEERGRVDGHALDDWLKAEVILRQRAPLAA